MVKNMQMSLRNNNFIKKVSCVIPCYNEGETIRNILKVVTIHPLIDEVIVVDDGSRDNTKIIVRDFGKVTLLEHPKNRGKSSAVCTGIRAALGEYIFLLDADLIGLTADDITKLLSPVLYHFVDESISLRKNPLVWRLTGADITTGDRVFPRKSLEGHLLEIDLLPSLNLEVFLNRLFIKKKFKVAVVSWDNVVGVYKHEKFGILSGIKKEILMWMEMLKTVSFFELAYQLVWIHYRREDFFD